MSDAQLLEVLTRSRGLGFLGSGSVGVQVDHAHGYADSLDEAPARFLDLGSGGGLPGLVLAVRWRDSDAVLLDGRERRCAFLRAAVQELGLSPRAAVMWARAEEAGRRNDLRGSFDVVVARGFGPPAVTAECGAPFLRVGGRLVVSEPPADATGDRDGGRRDELAASRWDPSGLATLGLVAGRPRGKRFRYQVLEQVELCSPRYPRRVGVPAKRPLF